MRPTIQLLTFPSVALTENEFVSVTALNDLMHNCFPPFFCLNFIGNDFNREGGYSHEDLNTAAGGRYSPRPPDNQVPVVQPPRREREYNWKLSGSTECSASCGKGADNQTDITFFK